MAECTQVGFEFAPHFSRRAVEEFSSVLILSGGGTLLLRQVAGRINLLPRAAACFTDVRTQERVDHPVSGTPVR